MSGALPFLLSFLIPIGVVSGILLGGLWNFLGIGLVFLAHPLLDFLLGQESIQPRTSGDLKSKVQFKTYSLILWVYVPVQLGIQYWILSKPERTPFLSLSWIGAAWSLGAMAGATGITAAHELIHRRNRWERFLGVTLLLSVCFPHYRVEHVFGHHRHVATPHDPATARKGESIYFFWIRSTIMGWLSAWKIENARAAAAKTFQWHRHRLIHYTLVQSSLIALIWALWGWKALVLFFIQSSMAVMLLETVDYIEHYGLVRRQTAPGRYEPATDLHSWDSRHRVTNWFLFNLGRHAHHHAQPFVRYENLQLSRSGHEFEQGYSSMIWLALCPPLWKREMDPKLQQPGDFK